MHRLILALLLSLLAAAPAREAPPHVLRDAMQTFVEAGQLSGAVTLLSQDGQILDYTTTGFQDLESRAPMAKDSLFWIASMTKPITALGILMLQDEGKLSIEDPVSKHLPEFKGQMLIKEKTAEQTVLVKPARPVTLKDLLIHTSGLIGSSPLDAAGAMDVLTLKEAVITYALSPLQFEPGSKWAYNNPGINTLGRVIEAVSGQDYAEFLQARLFTPLGMKDTTFWPDEAQLRRLAVSYKPGPEGQGLEPAIIRYLTAPYTSKKRTPLAAGGLFSTAADLHKLALMLMAGGETGGRRYLSKESLGLMTRNHTGDLKAGFTEGMGMGLGFQVVRQPTGVTATLSPGTYGHGGAHGTQIWLDPARRAIHILLIQRAGLSNGDASPMRQAFHENAAALLRP